ncbi:RNase adapter RapZ [Actinomycetaceae bacterium MB13-C1-2]|nr:RNase adapter RapZ [Actinomycetaceae bacterium MB13-C1-2]
MNEAEFKGNQDPLTAPHGIPALERKATTSPKSGEGASPNEILIITGRSGAGRSHAANALEDLDWYVVDNLPPAMLHALVGMMTTQGEGVHRLAAVVDVRGREFFKSLEGTLDELREQGVPYRIVYLEADDDELVRRFEANRRPHPLQGNGTLAEGLRAETELLAPLRARADEIIDTTGMSVHDLARHMRNTIAGAEDAPVQVSIMSFGFKHGLPLDADHVLDVRFVQNPYWVDELRRLTGRDQPVASYVMAQQGVEAFTDTYADLILSTLPGYAKELKPYVTVAVGCTGGRHRSVAVAERLASRMRDAGAQVHVIHRDMGRK